MIPMFSLINISATQINTIVTIVSIICTIFTAIWAYRTKTIKNELLEKLNSFEIVSYKDRLHKLYLDLSSKIRLKNWNQGGKNNDLLTNLDKELRDFNQFKGKIPSEKQESLKTTINSALQHLDSVCQGYTFSTTPLLKDLDIIDENLNSICNELMSK